MAAGREPNMKLGIVGTGKMTQMIAPYLTSWGVEVTAVAGTPRSAQKTRELIADYFPGAAAYDDQAVLMADPNVDTVYVAVPNFLHKPVSEQAMAAGKNVICEKPLASNAREAAELVAEAKAASVFFWEAVVTTRQPNFLLVRDELLGRIGDVKIATINYSQYSSRYDAFRAGEVLPAFDPAKAGGAIMDIGLYTLTYAIGLFGKPLTCRYAANVERNIDTSGISTLEYDGFQVACICSKDCNFTQTVIQGTEGSIVSNTAPNVCGAVTLRLNDGTEETYDRSLSAPWEGEFRHFQQQMASGDLAGCLRELDLSLEVSRVQTELRLGAGVVFPQD